MVCDSWGCGHLPVGQSGARDGVTALHLVSNNLDGAIPESLGPALGPTIQLIDLSSNVLGGTLPLSLLAGLPRLHTLFIEPKFDHNPDWQLKGTLPDDMGTSTGPFRSGKRNRARGGSLDFVSSSTTYWVPTCGPSVRADEQAKAI